MKEKYSRRKVFQPFIVATFILAFIYSCSLPSNTDQTDQTDQIDSPKVAIVSSTSSSILVGWTTIPDATEYEIWYNTSDDRESATLACSILQDEENLAHVYGLINGTIYYVWVRAKTLTETSEFSPSASILFGLISAPRAPNLTPLLTLESGQVSVKWGEVSGATAYEVWYSTSCNAAVATQYGGDITDTSTIVSGLTDGTKYNFWIRAKVSIGTSAFSHRSSTVCQTIQPLSINEWTPGSIIEEGIQWYSLSVISGVTYKFYWDDSKEGSGTYTGDISVYALHEDGSGIRFSHDSPFTSNDSAYNTPKTFNASDTEEILIKVREQNPGTFALKVSYGAPRRPNLGFGDGELIVNWTQIPEAISYEIWYNTTDDPASAIQFGGDITETSTIITGLTNGTKYYVWVRNKFPGGITSDFSSSSSKTPLYGQPMIMHTWMSGNFTSSEYQSAQWYFINVIEGEEYCISWDMDGRYYRYSGEYTGEISYIEGFHEGGTKRIFEYVEGTRYPPQVFTATKTESMYIRVVPYSAGTFAIKIGIPGPDAPTLTSGNGQLGVSWVGVAEATSYEVWYNTESNLSTATQFGDLISNTSTTITGLINGMNYYVWVRADISGIKTEFSPLNSSHPFLVQSIAFDTWTPGTLLLGQSKRYSFHGIAGTFYSIYWDDSYNGSGIYNCNVSVTAKRSDIPYNYFFLEHSSYDTPHTIQAQTSGLIYLDVSRFDGPPGSFAIRVNQE